MFYAFLKRFFFKKRKKTLYIHIGISKTGSTAIQKFLDKNSTFLEDFGLHYVKAGRVPNGESHHLFARQSRSTDQESMVALVDDIKKEICGSNCNKFIISSEGFEYLTNKDVCNLRRYFSFLNLNMVVYLRYQDHAISSMYNELVKKHACSDSFVAYVKKTPRVKLLKYTALLSRWERALGRRNLLVRVFDRNQFVGGDLIQDFLSTVGAEVFNYDLVSHSANEGVSNIAILLLAEINKHIDFEIDHVKNYGLACHLSRVLNNVIKSEFPSLAGASPSFFSSLDAYDSFMSVYKDDNCKVTSRYLNHQSLSSTFTSADSGITESLKLDILLALARKIDFSENAECLSANELIKKIGEYWSGKLRALANKPV